MTNMQVDKDNFDLWPCGLMVIDEFGQIQKLNATLENWLGMDLTASCQNLRLVDILSRASRIYFETHLRPLLIKKGHFSEISIELERIDGTRLGVFMNGHATLSEGRMIAAHFSILQNEQRHAFERELVAKRRESDVFKSLVRSSPHAIISVGTDLIIRAWNPAAEQLFGYPESQAINQRLDQLLMSPEDWDTVADDLERLMSGETVSREAIRLHKDGRRLQVEKSIAAIQHDTGEYTEFVAVYSDIGVRKASEAQIQTLLQEINHRSKNLLSVVQAMARQTGRIYEGEDFFAVFSKRLTSMASNQDLLINSHGNHVDLKTLARAQFAHLIDPDDPQIKIDGPAIHLNPSAAQAVGMAIFELVTNAAKYGALSQASGAVAFTWDITDDTPKGITLSWIETNGPPVNALTRQGFGYQVTGPILESITAGQVSREYEAGGLKWMLHAPYEYVTQANDAEEAAKI